MILKMKATLKGKHAQTIKRKIVSKMGSLKSPVLKLSAKVIKRNMKEDMNK